MGQREKDETLRSMADENMRDLEVLRNARLTDEETIRSLRAKLLESKREEVDARARLAMKKMTVGESMEQDELIDELLQAKALVRYELKRQLVKLGGTFVILAMCFLMIGGAGAFYIWIMQSMGAI